MKISIPDDTLLRRRVFSFYFLLTAIPFGLIALYGDLILGSEAWATIANWNQQPHSPSFFENAGLVTLYFALINTGFLLLPGYVRSLRQRACASRDSGNAFWLFSLAYNIVLCGVNGWYAREQVSGASLFSPSSGLPFWFVCFPAVGAAFSALCLTMPTNRHA